MWKAVMLMLKTWRNGASGGEVKNAIEYNFNLVSRYLTKDIKALSTEERNLLPLDYLSENTLVFDTDEIQWYKYSGGSWVKTSVDDNMYAQEISVSDWTDNVISIKFEQHGRMNPVVQLLMSSGNSFVNVIGGVEIDSLHNVVLSTDLPFDGKVVIK